MTILTENLHSGGYLVSERGGFYSRDQITFQPSTTLDTVPGTVLSKAGVPADETVTVAAAAGNTGNGTLTPDGTAPLAAGAIDGQYEVEFLSATEYQVSDPNGVVVGTGAVGGTFNGPLKFVIAAGGTAYAVADRILLTVLRPAGAADLWAPLAAGQVAAGILFGNVPPGTSSVQATAHVRECEVRAADLTWPSGFTNAQIEEATNQLRALGIILR